MQHTTDLKAAFSRPQSCALTAEDEGVFSAGSYPSEAEVQSEARGVLITELISKDNNEEIDAVNEYQSVAAGYEQEVHTSVLITELLEDDELASLPTKETIIDPKPNGDNLERPTSRENKSRSHQRSADSRKSLNIFEDDDWDTDLEDDVMEEDQGPPFRGLYKTLCEKCGCTPTSYFLRHIEDTNVNMKFHGFNTQECHALAQTLKSVICIETLDLEGNWVRHIGCRHLSKMLEDNEIIQNINLSDNKLGMDGITHLTQMLRINNSLKSLSISQNSLDDHAGLMLAESLEDSRLQTLDLSKNSFGEDTGVLFGTMIAANDYLDYLDLSWNKIRHRGAAAIAKGLKENIRLRVLDLSWNGLGEAGGNILADCLTVNSTLSELDISSNRLTFNVCQRFAKMINSNESLEVLKMANNPISTTGAITLISALNNSQVTAIKLLDLQQNPVEYEFMKTMKELNSNRPEIKVLHGSLLRSGNTTQDLGKRSVDPYGRNERPVLIMEEHLVINSPKRLLELLIKHGDVLDVQKGHVDSERLIYCLKIMDPSLNSKHLSQAVENIPKNRENLIVFRDLLNAVAH